MSWLVFFSVYTILDCEGLRESFGHSGYSRSTSLSLSSHDLGTDVADPSSSSRLASHRQNTPSKTDHPPSSSIAVVQP